MLIKRLNTIANYVAVAAICLAVGAGLRVLHEQPDQPIVANVSEPSAELKMAESLDRHFQKRTEMIYASMKANDE